MRHATRLALALAASVLLFAGGLAAQKTDSAQALLRTAMDKAAVDGDLPGAIKQYQAIVDKYGKTDRAVAATALLHMAECYQKLGDAQATKVYEQIVRDFGAQPEATAARARLATLTGTGVATSGMSDHLVWRASDDTPSDCKISPDARLVACIGKNDDLFLHDLVSGADRRLTKGNGDTQVDGIAFSRDNTQLAYSWDNGTTEEVRLIDLRGEGQPQSKRLFDGGSDITNLEPFDWTADGKWMALAIQRRDRTGQIGLLSAETGSLRALKSVDWRGPRNMALSPDGKYLAYDIPVAETNARDIFVIAVDASREIPVVVNSHAENQVVGWSSDGTQLLFTSDRTATTGLWAQPFTDGKPHGDAQLIKPDVGRILRPSGLSSAGGFYYSPSGPGVEADVKITSFDFATGRLTAPIADVVGGHFTSANQSPLWSPDGKSLAYVMNRGRDNARKDMSLAIKTMNTGQVHELRPQLNSLNYLWAWAPDGGSVAVAGSDFKGQYGAWRVDVKTGDVSPLGLAPPGAGQSFFSAWSTDGKIAYLNRQSPDVISFITYELATGRETELFRVPQTGNPAAGPAPLVNREGTKVYYRRPLADGKEGVAFIERDLSTGNEREVIRRASGGLASLAFPNLSPDGRYIATPSTDLATKSRSVLLISVATGELRELMRVDLPQANVDGTRPNALSVWMWAPDSRSLVAGKHLTIDALTELWWMPIDRSQSPQLVKVPDAGEVVRMSVHPDGRQIALELQPRAVKPPTELWVLEHFLPAAKEKR